MDIDYQSPLSNRYAADVLSLVYENGKIMATEMLRIARNYKTVTSTAEALVACGLMEVHVESGRRLMKIYTLTEKGLAVGKRMHECREILYGRAEPDVEPGEKASRRHSKS